MHQWEISVGGEQKRSGGEQAGKKAPRPCPSSGARGMLCIHPLSAPEALITVCAKPATSLGSFPHQEGRNASKPSWRCAVNGCAPSLMLADGPHYSSCESQHPVFMGETLNCAPMRGINRHTALSIPPSVPLASLCNVTLSS